MEDAHDVRDETGHGISSDQSTDSAEGNPNPDTGRRTIGPMGGVVFLILATLCMLFVDSHLVFFGPTGAYVRDTGVYTIFIVLPLAYAFFPSVFSKRFWRFPLGSWKWIGALLVVDLLVVGFQDEPESIPWSFLIKTILVAPLVEEIIKAVLISPQIERWGNVKAVLATGTILTLLHVQPWNVAVLIYAQTIMFVATDRSIPATALAHSLMNAMTMTLVAKPWLH